MNVCFGTVAYNNPVDIRDWLLQLKKYGASVRVSVSDNSSDSVAALEIRECCSEFGAQYISDGSNHGYFSGLNRIIKNNQGCDVYVVGNSDLTYAADFLQKLYLINPSKMDVVAPEILGENNNKLNPYMLRQESSMERWLLRVKFTSYLTYLVYAAVYKTGLIPLYERLYQGSLDGDRDEADIWAAHGSCLVLTKSYLEKCRILPEQNLLWLEENILALHARKCGARITYFPQLVVTHHGRGTTGGMSRKQKYAIKKRSFGNYISLFNQMSSGSDIARHG